MEVRSINLNELVAGTIDVPGENDEYTFTAAAGQQLYFDVRVAGTAFVPLAFSLRNPDGTVLFAASGSDRGVFSAPQSGTYTVVAGANTGDQTGDYQFGVFEIVAAGAGALPDSQGTDFWLAFPGTTGAPSCRTRLSCTSSSAPRKTPRSV